MDMIIIVSLSPDIEIVPHPGKVVVYIWKKKTKKTHYMFVHKSNKTKPENKI